MALKVLREEDAEDVDLVTRFEREARAASSLNQPNIVVVYEAGAASVAGREAPVHYLAMELIDGEPLSASLGGEPMPVRRFLDLATQLADGIARAHDSGIVHRDLKPSNFFVTSEGRVKIAVVRFSWGGSKGPPVFLRGTASIAPSYQHPRNKRLDPSEARPHHEDLAENRGAALWSAGRESPTGRRPAVSVAASKAAIAGSLDVRTSTFS